MLILYMFLWKTALKTNSKWWKTPSALGQPYPVFFKASKINAVWELLSSPEDNVLLLAIKADGAHHGNSRWCGRGQCRTSIWEAVCWYSIPAVAQKAMEKRIVTFSFSFVPLFDQNTSQYWLHGSCPYEKYEKNEAIYLVKLQWNAVSNFLLIKCYKKSLWFFFRQDQFIPLKSSSHHLVFSGQAV